MAEEHSGCLYSGSIYSELCLNPVVFAGWKLLGSKQPHFRAEYSWAKSLPQKQRFQQWSIAITIRVAEFCVIRTLKTVHIFNPPVKFPMRYGRTNSD